MDLVAKDSRWHVVGTWRRAFWAELRPGAELHGWRFEAGMLPLLLGLDARDHLDQNTPLDDVLPRDAPLSTRLSRGLERLPEAPDLRLLQTLNRGEGSLARVAAEEAVSSRTLRRRLVPLLGMAPRAWLAIRRFRDATALLAEARSLARLASDTGYSDQAHLSRECQRYAGHSPSALRRLLNEP